MCCAALRCAALWCWAVQCSAVLCCPCAVLSRAVLWCCAVLCCATVRVYTCGRAAAAAACSYLMFMKRAKQQICKHARKLRVLQLQLRACARQFCKFAKQLILQNLQACAQLLHAYICSCVHAYACTCALIIIANQMCNEANVHASRFANLKLAGVAIAYACSASARMQQKQACTCARKPNLQANCTQY